MTKWVSNLNDLAKHIGTERGLQTVIGIESVKLALKQAADLLYEILHEELQNYYDSFSPSTYVRTYNFLNSLRISPITQIANELMISVYFESDMATHPSLFGGEDGFVPILLNDGFAWRNNEAVNIYHLSHYEGFHFIEKSIARFNSQNVWGFRISKKGSYKGQ